MKNVLLKPIAWATGGCLLVLASGILSLYDALEPAVSIPLYMLLTVVVAWRAGFSAAIAVALCATLGLDFFFTLPHFSFTVSSRQDIFSLVAFAVVSLLISHLSQRIRAKANQLHSSEAQQRALYELSRSALLIDWKMSVERQLITLVQDKLQLDGVALWDGRDASFTSVGDAAYAVDRLQAAFRAERNYDLPNSKETLRILRFGVRPVGAMLFRGDVEQLMADAVATLIATHLERIRALKAEVSAESQAASERLRTAVLDGLAHAVKTPLTTIVVCSSGLREIGSLTPLQDELSQVIENQASYLSELTDQLLRTAKLENREMLLHPRTTHLQDSLDGATRELRTLYDTTRLQVTGNANCEVRLDPDLFRMILVQLIENGLKYSTDATKVEVLLEVNDSTLSVSVHNYGSYIPSAEQSLVFERYYRTTAMQHRAPGTGLGLSVAKHAVEAHGGRIWVDSHKDSGTTFHFIVPI